MPFFSLVVRTADRPGGGGGGQHPPVLPGSFNLPDCCSLWAELGGLVRGSFGIDIVPLGGLPQADFWSPRAYRKPQVFQQPKPDCLSRRSRPQNGAKLSVRAPLEAIPDTQTPLRFTPGIQVSV